MIAAKDDPTPDRNPVCPACGYPYSGPALCGWCCCVHVLTYDEMVGPPPKQDDSGVGTAIVVTLLVLLAVGIVVNQLLRLRNWLKRPPSSRP